MSTSRIFLGRSQSNEGMYVYPKRGAYALSLDPKQVLQGAKATKLACVRGRWKEKGQCIIPRPCPDVLLNEVTRRQDEWLTRQRRVVSTCATHNAALSKGRTITILGLDGDFVLHIKKWSQWEGEGVEIEEVPFSGTLAEARSKACQLCESPYGNPEVSP